jgi:two-component system OmpR family response regulator
MMNNPSLRRKILVLDDSDIALEVARQALRGAGYEVLTCSSPLGFSKLCMQTDPDVVVIDVDMPALKGNRLVEILRRSSKAAVPIILHSDRPVSDLQSLARACGADGAARKSPDCLPLLFETRKLLRG